MAPLDTTASMEPASNPANHQDPNHPHDSSDLEHQSGAHRFVFPKKRVLLAGGVITTILVIVAAVICGVAVARKNDDEGIDTPASTAAAISAVSAPLEMQNGFPNTTTVVCSTTRVPWLVTPSLATSTSILTTPRAPDAPFRPAAAETFLPTWTPRIPMPSGASVADVSVTGCFFNGAWALKAQCEKHCPPWNGHETRCEVSKRSQWVCVSCPSRL